MAERVSARRQLIGAAAVAVLALGAGGCALKGGQNISLVQGKILFVKNCGRCHTLARAGSSAEIGPNLDAAFAESISQGFGRSVIAGIVEQQIEYPNTAGLMPKLPLSTRQAADIADYVAYAAAKPGKDTGLLASAVSSGFLPPAVEKDGTLAIDANPQGLLALHGQQGDGDGRRDHDHDDQQVRRSRTTSRSRWARAAPSSKATPISASGTHSITPQPQARQLHVLLPGPRAPRRRHARDADGQIGVLGGTGARSGTHDTPARRLPTEARVVGALRAPRIRARGGPASPRARARGGANATSGHPTTVWDRG